MLSFVIVLCCIITTHSQQFDPTQHENWKYLQNEFCDVEPVDTTSRVYGGTQAHLCEYPWMAALVLKNPLNNKFYSCGGTILNQWTVLTAAHCFFLQDGITNFILETVVLGDWYQGSLRDCEGTNCAPPKQFIPPREVVIFQHYLPYANDIALIRLARGIQWNSCTKPVCMPKGNLLQNYFAGYEAEVAGWGISDLKTYKPNGYLNKATVRVLPSSECYLAGWYVPNSVICAIGADDRGKACEGDSGGPLMIKEKDESFASKPERVYIIGIVSFGEKNEKCGALGSATRYTRVSHFMYWILENLVENRLDVRVLENAVQKNK